MLYFNENDRFSSAWLRELFPAAKVDDRSIADVSAADVAGYGRAHFFGGIGGWEYALYLAGWPANWRVWTGSCPCQPFSIAGAGRGESDSRHLWPEFFRLIEGGKPPTVFGEQVASPAGRRWLNGVLTDMETLGYRTAAADLCSAGVGAPHIRQRLYWVADGRAASGLGNSESDHKRRLRKCGSSGGRNGEIRRPSAGCISGVDDSNDERLPAPKFSLVPGSRGRSKGGAIVKSSGSLGAWDNYEFIYCLDEKTRRIESSSFPLADGISNRVGLLRGYGNAITPQVAAVFIRAFVDTL